MVELTSSFELDVEQLDEDHRSLVEKVNRIVEEIDNGNLTICKSLVSDFVKSTMQHFSREENLLAKAEYPEIQEHSKHHRDLYERMDHILEFAEMASETDAARESLKKELVFFIMDDIINEDLKFKSFLREKRLNAEG